MQRKIVVTFKPAIAPSRASSRPPRTTKPTASSATWQHGAPPRVKSHAAAKRRSARQDGAESFAGVEVRAALIATSARATLRRHDSLVEEHRFEPSVPRPRRALLSGPPARCCEGQAAAKSALRFSPISPARRAIPSSRAGARFEQVVACWAARRLSPADGTTHIYLRPASAQPTIR